MSEVEEQEARHHRGSRLLLTSWRLLLQLDPPGLLTISTTDTYPQPLPFPFAISQLKTPLLPDRVSAGASFLQTRSAHMDAPTVSASTGVIRTLLPKLTMLIEGEHTLQNSVKRDIAFLKDELSSMQTLLTKLSSNEERLDVQLKDWRNKVCELSYDIEDCIDLFMHKMMNKGDAEGNLVSMIISRIKKIWSWHKMANLIGELKARVEEEGHRRKRYKFDGGHASSHVVVRVDPRLPALFVEAERLVGIDGPRKKIIELLESDGCGQQLKVISIVGFGGLGKTTLANQVYQKIKGRFDCSCFVPVSRNPNVSKILADMLKDLGSSCVDPSDDERQLINKLRAFLQDKRYG